MADNKAEFTVVCSPKYVVCKCPHCKEDVAIEYSDFLDMMPEEYYEEWVEEKVECPECGKEIEVGCVNWD